MKVMTTPKIKNKQHSLRIFETTDENLQNFKELYPGTHAGVFSLYTSKKIFSLSTTKKGEILCYVGQSQNIFEEIKRYTTGVPHNMDFKVTKGVPIIVKIHEIWPISEFEKLKENFQGTSGSAMNSIENKFVESEGKKGYKVVNGTHVKKRKNKRLKGNLKTKRKINPLVKPVNAYRYTTTKNGDIFLQLVKRFDSKKDADAHYKSNIEKSLKIPSKIQCQKKNLILIGRHILDYNRESDRRKRDQEFKGSAESKRYFKDCRKGKTSCSK